MKSILLAVLILTSIIAQAQQAASLKIRVNLEGSTQRDTLYFSFQNPVDSRSGDLRNLITAIRENGFYNFNIPTADSCGYFTLYKNRKHPTNKGGIITPIVNPQFWRSRDSVTINIEYTETWSGIYNKLFATGKGAEKYNLSKAIDSLRESDTHTESVVKNWAQLFRHPHQHTIDKSISLLESRRQYLEQFEYNILKANASANSIKYVSMRILEYFKSLRENKERKDFIEYYDQHIAQLTSTKIPDYAIGNSVYINYLMQLLRSESIIKTGSVDFDWIYEKIKANNEGIVKDRLLAISFLTLRKPSNLDFYIKDALTLVSDPSSRNIISGFSKFVEGSSFNSYNLEDTTGKKISLDSLMKNKIAFIDFWQDGCGYCSILFHEAIKPNEELFVKDEDVVFISVNLDKKKERWFRALKDGIYTSKHATNLTTGVLGFDHPIWRENKMKGTPSVLLIDRQGKIASYNAQELYTAEGLKKAILTLK